MEKRPGAALIATDNREEPSAGEPLWQAVSLISLKVRIPGKPTNAEVPGAATMFATGTNLTLQAT